MKNLVAALFLFFLLGCEGNSTETGNPEVTVQFSDFDTSEASAQQKNIFSAFNVNRVQFCFKRLRFKKASPSVDDEDDENVDLELGLVELSPDGTLLGQFELPEGIYTRIEFDLENDCLEQGAPSVLVENANSGSTPFTTNERITIRFEGEVSVPATRTLNLAIGNIISALESVTSGNQIPDALEDVGSTGEF